MVSNIDFRVEQFEKFYDLLMSNAPEGYIPWFFPCEKNGKNPDALTILKIDKNSKGSWHHESARLSRESAIELIKQEHNIGISARSNDALIIGDIDSPEYINQVPITLTTTSRKRCGIHFFGWDKDGSAKRNIPTNDGELRSSNQYVLACGSYVPFNLENEKDKKAFEKLTEEAKNDKYLGYYTVRTFKSPELIGFEDLPRLYKDKEINNLESDIKIKQTEENKDFKGEGKYSELFKLKVSDIIGAIQEKQRFGHPLHDSDTDANFSLSKDGTLGHCWRHLVSLNAVQFLCVKAGYMNCEDAGTPHNNRGLSKIKGDKKALEVAYNEALKMGLIKEWKNPIKKIGRVFSNKGQAEIFNEIQPIFYDKNGLWWLWNSNEYKWTVVDDVDILNMISDATGEDIITPKNRTIILNSLKQEGRKRIPREIKNTWIQFRDTIIDIETQEKIPASSEYFITNPLPYSLPYNDNSETPIMDKIFEEWVGKKYIKTLYEIISYCMLSDYPINRLFCFIGVGMNGKSKFLELLRNFIGTPNCCSTELDTLLHSRFEITRLHKKLVCMMGETNFNEMSETSIIKKLTGGDLIGFEYKNKNPFEEKNYAKILIATNNLPTTTDKTIGFYRRWMIIDFPNQFTEAKDILADIPEEEYNSLSLKCCKILNELLKQRSFTNEGSVEFRIKQYEDHSNPLEKFMKENIEEDTDGYIWKYEFLERLNFWCKDNRFREMSDVSIGKKMKEMSIGQRLIMNNDAGKQWRAWVGIKWKEINNQVNQDNQVTSTSLYT